MADELLTPEQREEYLAKLRLGIPPGLAAAEIGFTGTKLRGLRHRDAVFRRECEEAIEEGRIHYQERLSATAKLRALDDAQRSDRLLEVELATHVPGYEHLRRNKLEVGGTIEHAIVLPEGWLERAPTEVLEWVASLDGAGIVEDGEYTELRGPDDPPELNAAD